MMPFRKPFAMGACFVMALAVLEGSSARAQTPAPQVQQSELEEIIVTARQRQEKLSDVPATVQAFTANDIKAAGIERPLDFVGLTTGLSAVQTVEVGDLQLNIRGINSGRDTESSFALVVDGVLTTNPNVLNQELDGLTQLEVLKGPQGAIYGRNALAGAIIVTTKKPGDTFEADVKLGAGNNKQFKGSFSVGGPISDSVSGLLRAYTSHDNGSFRNSLTGCDNCENYMRETGVNGRLIIKPSDAAEFDIKVRYSKVDAGAVTFNASLGLTDAAAFFGANPAFTPPGVNASDFFEDPNKHKFVYLNSVYPINQQRNKDISVKGVFDLGFSTLTSVLAFNDETNFFLSDGTSNAFGIYNANPVCQASYAAANGTVPLPSPFFYAGPPGTSGAIGSSFLPPYPPVTCGGYQYQQRDQKDGAIELRLTSPGDQRLRWMGGLYYGQIKRHLVVSYGGDLGTGVYNYGFVPSTGPNPTDLLFDDTFRSNVYAGFGNVAYDLAKNLELAVALRYDLEDRTDDNGVPKINPQTPGFGAFGVPVCPSGPTGCSYYINPYYNANPTVSSIPSRHAAFGQFQPKVSLNWKATDDWAFFGSYGYGFRSGGFNSSGDAATLQRAYGTLRLDDGTPNLNFNALTDEFKKEVSRAAELGFKAVLFDRRLSLNGALYYTKVDNMQNFSFYAGTFGSLRIVDNMDKVDIKGVETDVRWRAHEYLTVFAGFGYTDAKIKKYSTRPYTVGNKVPYVPDYTANLGIELRMPLTSSGLQLTARIDEPFTGKTFFSTVQGIPGCAVCADRLPNAFTGAGFGQGNFTKQYRAAYAVTNLHVSLSGANWDVTAWGDNLTDKRYLAEIIPAPEFGGSFIHDSYGRSYGVNVSYKFGRDR